MSGFVIGLSIDAACSTEGVWEKTMGHFSACSIPRFHN